MFNLTVVIDSREQQPLPFPGHIKVHLRRSKTPTMIKIATEVDTMPAGDYTLKGFSHVVLVETKRSAREVSENLLTADYRRASRALERLANSTKNPILVCEFGQSELYADDLLPGTPDALAHIIARHHLSTWFAGPRIADSARRRTADMVMRLMVACVEMDYPNFLHGDADGNVPGEVDSSGDGRKRRTGGRPRRSRVRAARA